MDAIALVVKEFVVAFAGRKKSLKAKRGMSARWDHLLTNWACPSRSFCCLVAHSRRVYNSGALRVALISLAVIHSGMAHRQLQMRSCVLTPQYPNKLGFMLFDMSN